MDQFSIGLTFASCTNGVVSTQPILHGVISNHLILFFIQREWFQIPPLGSKSNIKTVQSFFIPMGSSNSSCYFRKGARFNRHPLLTPVLMRLMKYNPMSLIRCYRVYLEITPLLYVETFAITISEHSTLEIVKDIYGVL